MTRTAISASLHSIETPVLMAYLPTLAEAARQEAHWAADVQLTIVCAVLVWSRGRSVARVAEAAGMDDRQIFDRARRVSHDTVRAVDGATPAAAAPALLRALLGQGARR